jgi:FMN reductase
MSLVAVNGSPSDTSKTHALTVAAARLGQGSVIDVSSLDANALVLRGEHPSVRDALAAISAATTLVLITPVYRATYSGLLKLVLDQLPPECLHNTAVVLAANGNSPAHFLSLDTGLRAVVASLGGWTVPTVVYATGADFGEDNEPNPELLGRLRAALAEADRILPPA